MGAQQQGAPAQHIRTPRDTLDRRGGGGVREMAMELTAAEVVVAERRWWLASSKPAQLFREGRWRAKAVS